MEDETVATQDKRHAKVPTSESQPKKRRVDTSREVFKGTSICSTRFLYF